MLSFLNGSEALGPAPALLTELAAQDGVPQAVSKLLSRLAQAVIRCEETSPWPERAPALSRCALEAHWSPLLSPARDGSPTPTGSTMPPG